MRQANLLSIIIRENIYVVIVKELVIMLVAANLRNNNLHPLSFKFE